MQTRCCPAQPGWLGPPQSRWLPARASRQAGTYTHASGLQVGSSQRVTQPALLHLRQKTSSNRLTLETSCSATRCCHRPCRCTTAACCAAGMAAALESARRSGSNVAAMAARPRSTACLPSSPASSTNTLQSEAGRGAGAVQSGSGAAQSGAGTGRGTVEQSMLLLRECRALPADCAPVHPHPSVVAASHQHGMLRRRCVQSRCIRRAAAGCACASIASCCSRARRKGSSLWLHCCQAEHGSG